MRFSILCAVALLALCAALLAGCGGGAPPATATPTPTPAELSARIGRATADSSSLHFSIALSGKPVYTDTSNVFVIRSIEGDLRRPDGVLATLKVSSPALLAEIRLVSYQGQQYVTNPITRQWMCLGSGRIFDPLVLFDPQVGVENLIQRGLDGAELVGSEPLDGAPHYHLRGALDGALLLPISANSLGFGPVAVDLWADMQTLRVTKLVMVDTATDPADPSTWTVTFSDYGKQIDIRAPVAC